MALLRVASGNRLAAPSARGSKGQPTQLSPRRGEDEVALHLPVLRAEVAQVARQVPRVRGVELAGRGARGTQRLSARQLWRRRLEAGPLESSRLGGGRTRANRHRGAGSRPRRWSCPWLAGV